MVRQYWCTFPKQQEPPWTSQDQQAGRNWHWSWDVARDAWWLHGRLYSALGPVGSTFFMLPQLCPREGEVWSIQSLFVSIATVDARQHANSDILLTMECSSHMFTIYRSDLEACGDVPYMDGIPSWRWRVVKNWKFRKGNFCWPLKPLSFVSRAWWIIMNYNPKCWFEIPWISPETFLLKMHDLSDPISPRWWFPTFFIFSPTWGEDSHFWLIFFKGVETTNQSPFPINYLYTFLVFRWWLWEKNHPFHWGNAPGLDGACRHGSTTCNFCAKLAPKWVYPKKCDMFFFGDSYLPRLVTCSEKWW